LFKKNKTFEEKKKRIKENIIYKKKESLQQIVIDIAEFILNNQLKVQFNQ
jgi:hypothetical protein